MAAISLGKEYAAITEGLSGISGDLGMLYRKSFLNVPLGFLPILANPAIVEIARENPGELSDLFADMQDYNDTPRKGGLPSCDWTKYRAAMEKAKTLGLAD